MSPLIDKSKDIIENQVENEDIEIKLLLDAIQIKYGHDFTNYARASIKRRVKQRLALSGLRDYSEMLHKVLYDENFLNTLLLDFSINVTEMFRDPEFYVAVKKKVLPLLSEYEHIKIWHAGCATGEEVYSMAIMLKEMEIYDRATIYATDFNELTIQKARNGIFPMDRMRLYEENYKLANGKKSLSDYYISKYGNAMLDKSLRKNIVFADHNLVTDWVFGEMNLIFCRNVLIYFNRNLQNRVLNLFSESLGEKGFLCLGTKESLSFSDHAKNFVHIAEQHKIYQKSEKSDEK